jgi:hypothetical protein
VLFTGPIYALSLRAQPHRSVRTGHFSGISRPARLCSYSALWLLCNAPARQIFKREVASSSGSCKTRAPVAMSLLHVTSAMTSANSRLLHRGVLKKRNFTDPNYEKKTKVHRVFVGDEPSYGTPILRVIRPAYFLFPCQLNAFKCTSTGFAFCCQQQS